MVGQKVVALDVETTGLSGGDRMLSFGSVAVDVSELADGDHSVTCSHLVFDPGRRSHGRALAIHGWDDWTLRFQDGFDIHADDVADTIENADLVVGHHVAFDRGFIDRAFSDLGRRVSWPETACTLSMAQAEGMPGRLDALAATFGMKRTGERHGALEDAYLAFAVWARLSGAGRPTIPTNLWRLPYNYRPAPPKLGRAPNRSTMGSLTAAWNAVFVDMLLLSPIAATSSAASCALVDILAERAPKGLVSEWVAALSHCPASAADRSAAAFWVADDDGVEISRLAERLIRADGRVESEELVALRVVIESVMAGRRARRGQ